MALALTSTPGNTTVTEDGVVRWQCAANLNNARITWSRVRGRFTPVGMLATWACHVGMPRERATRVDTACTMRSISACPKMLSHLVSGGIPEKGAVSVVSMTEFGAKYKNFGHSDKSLLWNCGIVICSWAR